MGAFASSALTTPTERAEMFGPPVALRASAGVSGNWERSYIAAGVPVDALSAMVIAGAVERKHQALVNALSQLAAEEEARKAAAAAAAPAPRQAGVPTTLNRSSGYAAGTLLTARITIYGCTGPGGGFCGNMASGVVVFEGAAACSSDLPMGTKLRIIGDPTGRTYECLDRGHLSTTWVDVFFHNTTEGIRWQGMVGGTRAQIEIVN